ncbi:IclR family transcriptional regulator C-terminal domain-containing protein [Arthrobacter sp. KFRI-F3372]|uniref:IclR family transcriptional regulator domain-containing protein n=1 Tax=Pseudarthrobacter oxydans TaxID=1671 RepID=UPI00279B83FC|nr:IclR family transcriptional regulator C-terminal domain-containing protein [Arthrobacter sp. KFRI-F3372]
MLLSALPPKELDALFPDDAALPAMTAQSINSRERLLVELATARERGWSEENSESNENVACVAAPIFDRAGSCVAAMSISTPTLRWGEKQREDYVKLVVKGAREISTNLGSLSVR